MDAIAQRIAQLRKEFHMSQSDLAERLKVHQTAISQWETGRTMPNYDIIAEMCLLFNVSTDYLLGRTDQRGRMWIPKEEGETLAQRLQRSDELDLILDIEENFSKLNFSGKKEAAKRINELTQIEKYTKLED